MYCLHRLYLQQLQCNRNTVWISNVSTSTNISTFFSHKTISVVTFTFVTTSNWPTVTEIVASSVKRLDQRKRTWCSTSIKCVRRSSVCTVVNRTLPSLPSPALTVAPASGNVYTIPSTVKDVDPSLRSNSGNQLR